KQSTDEPPLKLVRVLLGQLSGSGQRGRLPPYGERCFPSKRLLHPVLDQTNRQVRNVYAHPRPTESLGNSHRSPAPTEGIQHHIPRITARSDDSLEQRFRFLRWVTQPFFRYWSDDFDVPNVTHRNARRLDIECARLQPLAILEDGVLLFGTPCLHGAGRQFVVQHIECGAAVPVFCVAQKHVVYTLKIPRHTRHSPIPPNDLVSKAWASEAGIQQHLQVMA